MSRPIKTNSFAAMDRDAQKILFYQRVFMSGMRQLDKIHNSVPAAPGVTEELITQLLYTLEETIDNIIVSAKDVKSGVDGLKANPRERWL